VTVLCCGDRAWTDRETIARELAALGPGTVVVHGACRGADMLSDSVASVLGYGRRSFPAKWDEHGRAAGPIRNRHMVKANPDIELVLAFHNNISASRGTADMVSVARKVGIPVRIVISQPVAPSEGRIRP
jgi:hypothetical protein